MLSFETLVCDCRVGEVQSSIEMFEDTQKMFCEREYCERQD